MKISLVYDDLSLSTHDRETDVFVTRPLSTTSHNPISVYEQGEETVVAAVTAVTAVAATSSSTEWVLFAEGDVTSDPAVRYARVGGRTPKNKIQDRCERGGGGAEKTQNTIQVRYERDGGLGEGGGGGGGGRRRMWWWWWWFCIIARPT